MQLAVVAFFSCVCLFLSCFLSRYNNFNIGLAELWSSVSRKFVFVTYAART